MMPFCNNLRKGDQVEDAITKRRGVVAMQPRDHSPRVMVTLDGCNAPRPFPVGRLRLVVDGVAEEVPPVDGEIPAAGIEPRLRSTEVQRNEFEAHAQPLKYPARTLVTGEHVKHYLVSYIREDGKFHLEKVAAPGIRQAIDLFYIMHRETAIVSVVCVL